MSLKNTSDQYGLVAKGFHWVIALLILGLILVGLYMTSLAYSPEKIELYGTHKSFGLLVLWLVGLRLIWRFISKPPEADIGHEFWEKILARLAHFFLYVAMIGMPLSGWLMSSAGQYPVPFFGIEMPDLVGKNPALAKFMNTVHEVLSYLLIIVIGLHALGALKHHFIDKDETLRRMTGPKATFKAILLVIFLGLFFVIVGKFILNKKEIKIESEKQTAEEIKKDETTDEQKDMASVQAWTINLEKSSLQFQSSVTGKNFTGRFEEFSGDINFDPNNLAESKVKITVNTGSLDSDDKERDDQMKSADWFYITSYPDAVFETIAFEPAEEGQYIVVANLTIRDVTMPVTMPFTLEMKKKGSEAHVKGLVTLNRLNFGLGQGQWETTETVGSEVQVAIDLVASAQ